MMYFTNVEQKNAFVGASAAASFSMPTSAKRNILGTVLLAVSIFILCLRLWTLPALMIRIMLVSVLLTVLVNCAERRPEGQGSVPLAFLLG